LLSRMLMTGYIFQGRPSCFTSTMQCYPDVHVSDKESPLFTALIAPLGGEERLERNAKSLDNVLLITDAINCK
jgi:hypothetical protein